MRIEKISYCYSFGRVVSCNAPIMCNENCRKYKAKLVTGIKSEDLGGGLVIVTGWVDGTRKVQVTDQTAIMLRSKQLKLKR